MHLSWKALTRLGGAIVLAGVAISLWHYNVRAFYQLGLLISVGGILLSYYGSTKRPSTARSPDSASSERRTVGRNYASFFALGGMCSLLIVLVGVYIFLPDRLTRVDVTIFFGLSFLAVLVVLAFFIWRNRRGSH